MKKLLALALTALLLTGCAAGPDAQPQPETGALREEPTATSEAVPVPQEELYTDTAVPEIPEPEAEAIWHLSLKMPAHSANPPQKQFH
jgi:PBP1b-binding outer membrane lipoprotein LpoB